MSSVWSASIANGVGDLACHMCLSAYKLTGWDRDCVDSTRGKQLEKQGLNLREAEFNTLGSGLYRSH